jgi:hypothetical protein
MVGLRARCGHSLVITTESLVMSDHQPLSVTLLLQQAEALDSLGPPFSGYRKNGSEAGFVTDESLLPVGRANWGAGVLSHGD